MNLIDLTTVIQDKETDWPRTVQDYSISLLKHKSAYFLFHEHEKFSPLDLEQTQRAINTLLKPNKPLQKKIENQLFTLWQDFNQAVGYLDTIETFQTQADRPDWMEKSLQTKLKLKNLKSPEQIWNYIEIDTILVSRQMNQLVNGDIYFGIGIKPLWDDEHELQIILQNGKHLAQPVSENCGELI